MKKLFLILALGIAFVSKSNSQSWNTVGNLVNSTDYLGGNLSSTAPLLIKMRANYGLNFFSNDLERMRILNTGEVGIGTTTPASWLHVDAGSSAEVFRTSTTSTIARWRMFKSGQEIGQLTSPTGTNFTVQATQNYLKLQ